MRGFLIDPAAKTIAEVHDDGSWSLQALRAAIQTDAISGAALSPDRRTSDRVWVDDNGFLKAGAPVFFVGEYAMPLAGRGLVLGLTGSGANKDPAIQLEDLRAAVHFTNLESKGALTPMMETATGFHMGFPICVPARDWAPKVPALASFTFELWGQIIRLEDVGAHTLVPSVTNDAEAVFKVLADAVGPRMAFTPVIYRDSEGQWDAMLPKEDGTFRSFLVLGASSFEAAREKLDAMFGPDQ